MKNTISTLDLEYALSDFSDYTPLGLSLVTLKSNFN